MKLHALLKILTGIFIGQVGLVFSQEPAIEFKLETVHETTIVAVLGLTQEQLGSATSHCQTRVGSERLLSLFVATDTKQQTPVMGTRSVENGKLLFIPRFPLKPGLEYVVQFTLEKQTAQATLRLPANTPQALADVTAIYPSADKLPQNVLRVYIHFSQPMSRGNAYEHIELLDEDGKRVEFPFVELPQELWDPDQKRFALLFDPGRIKKELTPRAELGPPLMPGQKYTLVIHRTWKDAQGKELAEEARKVFSTVEPLSTQLDVKKWLIDFPDNSRTASLQIEFDRSMNQAMLLDSIRVQRGDQIIEGSIAVSRNETKWAFTPREPWMAGRYQLVLDNDIEDIAGNKISRPFEVDLAEPRQASTPTASSTIIPFQIGQ